MKLRPESEKLLVELVKYSKVWSISEACTGSLAAVIGGILPKGSEAQVGHCTEQDCDRARQSLSVLSFWGFIYLHPASVTPVEREGQWNWLFKSIVALTPKGISYVERSNYPWYRKWWGNIPSDLRILIITVLGVIIATLLMHLFGLI